MDGLCHLGPSKGKHKPCPHHLADNKGGSQFSAKSEAFFFLKKKTKSKNDNCLLHTNLETITSIVVL
jgi:hypothetical protein